MDDRFKHYKDCEILGVYEKKLTNIKDSGSYLLEIACHVEESCFPKYVDVYIDKHDLYTDLKRLISGETDRLALAYGMADVDIYKCQPNQYCIEWSPNESSYTVMHFNEDSFMQDFVNTLKMDEDKQF